MIDIIKKMVKGCMNTLLPIKTNKIVFVNFNGRGYGCNPKYIAEELHRRNTTYDMVWLVLDKNEKLPSWIRPVEILSWRASYELITAKIWVSNVRNSRGVRKRRQQFYVQTWHSSLAFKKIEGQISNLPASKIAESSYDGSITDLMFANNEVRYNQYRNYFWYEGEILRCGVPRNSILFADNPNVTMQIKEEYGIDQHTDIILYAPTFRKKAPIDVYKWDYEKVISAYEEKHGRRAVMLLRLHPNVAESSKELSYNEKVINASMYPDMQELLAASNLLITDYSGCAFDFSFAYKQVVILAKDLEEYLANERELIFNFSELPYPICRDEDAVAEEIYKYNFDEYKIRYNQFFKRIHMVEDGKGAKTIADIIDDVIGGRRKLVDGKWR